MRKLSDTVKDLPMSPSKSIVYWTEYVLRHDGAEHLRTVAADMPFYQYLLLDVIAFMVVTFIVLLSVLIYVCKKIYKSVITVKRESRVNANKKKQ